MIQNNDDDLISAIFVNSLALGKSNTMSPDQSVVVSNLICDTAATYGILKKSIEI